MANLFTAGQNVVVRIQSELFMFVARLGVPPATMCKLSRAIWFGLIFSTFNALTNWILITFCHTLTTSRNVSSVELIKIPISSLLIFFPFTFVMCALILIIWNILTWDFVLNG